MLQRSHVSGCSDSYRGDPTGPTAGLAEPVPRDDMPAVSGAAGGNGVVKGRRTGGAGRPPRHLRSFILVCCETTSTRWLLVKTRVRHSSNIQ